MVLVAARPVDPVVDPAADPAERTVVTLAVADLAVDPTRLPPDLTGVTARSIPTMGTETCTDVSRISALRMWSCTIAHSNDDPHPFSLSPFLRLNEASILSLHIAHPQLAPG